MSLCWRCGRVDHADWCSDGTPNDCTHCGGNPCRWWCLGDDRVFAGMNPGAADGGYRRAVWGLHEPVRVMEPA